MLERVRSWLQWPIEETQRLAELCGLSNGHEPMEIPDGRELQETLRLLDVPPHATDEIGSARPTKRDDPEAWWLLERLYEQLIEPNGSAVAPPWPSPEPSGDALTRYFHLYAFLAAVPAIRRLHASRGIPSDVLWDTLSDVGLQVAHYQSRNGRPGFDGAFWMWHHFRGHVYRLGRLQYDLRSEHDATALGLHIPAHGRLTREGCDDSLERARLFFPRHFPERRYPIAICASWLLDEQLAEYLPPETNIVQFQRRFTMDPDWSRPGDKDTLLFTFGYVPESMDELPQRTRLERAVVQHLRDGRHWQIRLGSIEL
jgi:hypothetical protein